MSLTDPAYPPPQRNRTSTILTISILVAFFLLIGLSWMVFAVQNGLVALVTPTPTPTPRAATPTPTPDVRATHIAEDMLTQVAFAATAIMRLTQTPSGVVLSPDSPLPPEPGQPTAPETRPTQSVQLPLVAIGEAQPASPLPPDQPPAEAQFPAEALTATAIFMPGVAVGEAAPTPTPPFLEPPPSPTPEFIPPTDTPTPFVAPPPTPTPFISVQSLAAITRAGADTAVYIGPSTFYTRSEITLPPNTQIQLRGRTLAGDWLFGCCINNSQGFWVRPAYVTIGGNPVPPAFPPGVDLNSPQWDVNNPKWLPIIPVDGSLIPRPQPTSPPFGDFPLARYDRGNTGRLPMLPRPPLFDAWGALTHAGAAFRSPVAVMGPNVIAGNDDGQLYSLNRDVGSQRWRYGLGGVGALAPAVNDGLIYFPYAGNRMVVVQDGGTFANLVSNIDLPGLITTSPTFLNDVVFLGVGEGGAARLVAMKRDNLNDRREVSLPLSSQPRLLQPAIGQEVIYAAGDKVWAIDVNLWSGIEVIWESANLGPIAAPPVYTFPGVIRTAELYVADVSGNLHALDANTGARIWTYPSGAPIAMLAVNDSAVFAAGGGLLRAVSRQNGQLLWTAQTGGNLAGGPFVANDRVLVITQNGAVFYDANSGAVLDAATFFRSPLLAAPAVSQEWLFAPSNMSIFGYRGNP
ncbi:PQQ-binding-like beta-propeller repeat protein [Caldilinea sp.]|jgi:hypothetical protein|nr:PQQ-binding-like beta-propeller repeat protein [Caldilinea sp.]GIV67533.1 MAG: hypothetical protein KatS3mg048_0395 [Caldilinea sp.]